jgi:hypothetical protein
MKENKSKIAENAKKYKKALCFGQKTFKMREKIIFRR